jgi:uncharacterized protein RhaS with RHS repeats
MKLGMGLVPSAKMGAMLGTSTPMMTASERMLSASRITLTRPTQAAVTVGGTNYTFAATYDGNSRLSGVTYPSGLALNYTYTSLGYASQIVGPGGLAYWTANTRDAELRLTQETAGNGVVTTQSFDAQTGRLMDILAGTGNIVQNFSNTYDVLGNVLTRADANESLTETFTYDNLNRVTSATVSASVAVPVKTFTYDATGNLLSKSDVGNYNYPLAGSALPHAVMSTSGGAVSTSFTYDPNGNQTSAAASPTPPTTSRRRSRRGRARCSSPTTRTTSASSRCRRRDDALLRRVRRPHRAGSPRRHRSGTTSSAAAAAWWACGCSPRPA